MPRRRRRSSSSQVLKRRPSSRLVKQRFSRSKQTARASRPSPSCSATLFKIGTVRLGNDGNLWKIRNNSAGVRRWVKQ